MEAHKKTLENNTDQIRGHKCGIERVYTVCLKYFFLLQQMNTIKINLALLQLEMILSKVQNRKSTHQNHLEVINFF